MNNLTQPSMDQLYQMVKDLESINVYLSQFMDTIAIKKSENFKRLYKQYGFTVLFDEVNRLALLRKI